MDYNMVHAHLHRVKGGLVNTAYWYRRRGRPIVTIPLDQEWANIAEEMLARPRSE